MTKRKPIVGISLKMYQNQLKEAQHFAQKISDLTGQVEAVEQFMCPGMGVLYPVSVLLRETNIGLGAQNMAPVAYGAYTGEFSIDSLLDMEGTYVELGHIERRTIFSESDDMINQKVLLALEKNVIPVLCIGESEHSEDYEEIKNLLLKQLFLALNQVPHKQAEKVILAYEPAWAVGKTLAASAVHVHAVHGIIRECLTELYSYETAQKTRIIYGGSVSQENVQLIVSDENVDGVFVGRFGHDPERYANIVKTVKMIKEGKGCLE
ncbi:triose-phosphate isomerase [Enterococcus ureilyticus]|uniref:Triosephosphate isomerase n=1 Tax=Enterococcus ureilyticus TaxID=1131292 RepID=A0A1E5HF11_9ENTE|nr:triose-phosphate isomerase family protein [Enterococcus ureilyticus]MBM7689253.1 triosephosphate isomerase [Enterococcus ureilyticus]MBO0446382.1 triose-phosphate isomerase [Enterococcus ureilyticus]OEG23529.1 triose-phosphate isomerase [Enterococcus ureilyticus]